MRKLYKSPVLLLALGILVIGTSTATATRAAMVYQTTAERVNFSTAIFSVNLMENVDGEYVSLSDTQGLQFPEIQKDDSFKIGKRYEEDVKVVNNSNADTGYSEYVRVVVRKSWSDENGKNTNLDPSLIKLDIADGWYLNDSESTPERAVYYMTSPLACGNEAQFLEGITVDNSVTSFVTTTETEASIVNEYTYNGESVYIQLTADAVQTHNSEDAIYAAWGVKATCSAADDGNIITIDGKPTE